MDLAHIRQKIIEMQRGTGMDPALIMFLAIAAAVVVAVILVLVLETARRRRRCSEKAEPRRRVRSVR